MKEELVRGKLESFSKAETQVYLSREPYSPIPSSAMAFSTSPTACLEAPILTSPPPSLPFMLPEASRMTSIFRLLFHFY